MTQDATIEDVIDRLTVIIDAATREQSRLGYFPALYRKVTQRVKQGIAAGEFDDGARMTRLDVTFAHRYLDALATYQRGGTPTRSWAFAFQVGEQWWPIVLQHLLLGINAHINLDLGIAAARSVSAAQLPDLRGDFDKINTILASLVGSVQDELAEIWMTLGWLNRYLGTFDDAIINFSMTKARDRAWSVAERLAPLDMAAQTREIERLDREALSVARLVRYPGPTVGSVVKVVRLGERGSIPQIIEILS